MNIWSNTGKTGAPDDTTYRRSFKFTIPTEKYMMIKLSQDVFIVLDQNGTKSKWTRGIYHSNMFPTKLFNQKTTVCNWVTQNKMHSVQFYFILIILFYFILFHFLSIFFYFISFHFILLYFISIFLGGGQGNSA